jgi:predicted amidohydrolase YtcJ
MRLQLTSFISLLFLVSCSPKQKADLLVYNATIYTVDSSFFVAEAMIVKDGRITAIGKLADLENQYEVNEKIDGGGKYIYPGFIDAHAHLWVMAPDCKPLILWNHQLG